MELTAKTRTKAQQEGELVNDGDKVWVTVSRNVNLGNYENYKLEAGYSKTIQAGESPIELVKEMESELAPFVNKQARSIKKKRIRREVQ